MRYSVYIYNKQSRYYSLLVEWKQCRYWH